MSDAEVERAADDGAAVFENIHASEVMPKTERNERKLDAGATAATIKRGLGVTISGGGIHERDSFYAWTTGGGHSPMRGVNWCGRRESKPADSLSQSVADQFAAYLAGAGDVAGDAQIDLGLAAIGVLRVYERELEIDAHVKACESGPLPKLPAGAGVSPVRPEAVAASSAEPCDTGLASRASANCAPSKPVWNEGGAS